MYIVIFIMLNDIKTNIRKSHISNYLTKSRKLFQDVFGDMLITQPVQNNETQLPSPHQLQKKILLKHKKLPDGQDESAFLVRNDDGREMDLRNTVKNGIMYLKDDNEWNPHFFVLTQNKLFYTDSYRTEQVKKKLFLK